MMHLRVNGNKNLLEIFLNEVESELILYLFVIFELER